jgi:hypothetical protein
LYHVAGGGFPGIFHDFQGLVLYSLVVV